MRIIAGSARNIELTAPPGSGVRPTAVRSRKALFDSLGTLLAGSVVWDLFAGSGALGLEAASRGAAALVSVELDRTHLRFLRANVAKVQRAGVTCPIEIVEGSALSSAGYAGKAGIPNLIFSDPPYPRSAEFFTALLNSPGFTAAAEGALLIWELPDTPGAVGEFFNPPHLADWKIRNFCGTDFLFGRILA